MCVQWLVCLSVHLFVRSFLHSSINPPSCNVSYKTAIYFSFLQICFHLSLFIFLVVIRGCAHRSVGQSVGRLVHWSAHPLVGPKRKFLVGQKRAKMSKNEDSDDVAGRDQTSYDLFCVYELVLLFVLSFLGSLVLLFSVFLTFFLSFFCLFFLFFVCSFFHSFFL